MLARVAVVFALAAVASAHLCLLNPPQRGTLPFEDKLNAGASPYCAYSHGVDSIYDAPCGSQPAQRPTLWLDGSQATVIFQKNANHWSGVEPAHFIVNFCSSPVMDHCVELCRINDTTTTAPLLHEWTGYLPFDTAHGVIQAAYVTSDVGTFFQCADVAVQNSPTAITSFNTFTAVPSPTTPTVIFTTSPTVITSTPTTKTPTSAPTYQCIDISKETCTFGEPTKDISVTKKEKSSPTGTSGALCCVPSSQTAVATAKANSKHGAINVYTTSTTKANGDYCIIESSKTDVTYWNVDWTCLCDLESQGTSGFQGLTWAQGTTDPCLAFTTNAAGTTTFTVSVAATTSSPLSTNAGSMVSASLATLALAAVLALVF